MLQKPTKRSSSIMGLSFTGWAGLVIASTLAISLLWTGISRGAPPAPVPVLPAEGSTIITPSMSWLASPGAVRYKLEIGPQSNPALVYWTDQTPNLDMTPSDAASLPNEALYWRVCGMDAGSVWGAWSARVNFTKHIPTPALRGPENLDVVAIPLFAWQPVDGAAYYRLELSLSPLFAPVAYSYDSYNTSLAPVDAIPPATYYWRVRGMDAHDHDGTNSEVRQLTRLMQAPVVQWPADGAVGAMRRYAWLPVEGASHYEVELSTAANFVPIARTLTTYANSVVDVSTLAQGAYYWRVHGVDTQGNPGWNSAVRTQVVRYGPPDLVSPADNASVTQAVFTWTAAEGAAYYKLEISANCTGSYTSTNRKTYNLRQVPALAPGTYCWRVQPFNRSDQAGELSVVRRVIVAAPPVATDPQLALQTPGSGAALAGDPDFAWTAYTGAASYRLVVSTNSGFTSTYDAVITGATAYTPAEPGIEYTYTNGTYYWKVEARNSAYTVIATSAIRSFTKTAPLNLIAPADGAVEQSFPNLSWEPVQGASTYFVRVSTDPGFSSTFDSVTTSFQAYIPYQPGARYVYPGGVYYWKVAARDNAGTTIMESPGRSFTVSYPLALSPRGRGTP